MFVVPVLAEGPQHLAALVVGEHARERAVLSQLAGNLVRACENPDDVVDAAIDDSLPLLKVARGHAISTVPWLPAGDVLLSRLQHALRVDHEMAQQGTVQPQALLLLQGESGLEPLPDFGASDPAVRAGLHAGQLAAVAQIDDVLARDAEHARYLARGQPVVVHSNHRNPNHQKHHGLQKTTPTVCTPLVRRRQYLQVMTFHATVVQVLVASPGDTQAERTAILAETSRWNGRYARGREFVFSPWLYELHSTPILGDRPQAIINSQGVDRSDVVVAVFAARLGSGTGVDISGTTEEIKRARKKGIPVHVFFSDAGLPRDVDVNQLQKLREFQESLKDEGLYASYSDAKDLARQVIEALEFDLDAFDAVPAPEAPSGVKLEVRHDHHKEPTRPNKQGKMQYRSAVRDLVITNKGDATAEDLKLHVEVPEGNRLKMDDLESDGWTSPQDLTEGSSFNLLCFPRLGRTDAQITVRWIENGEKHTRRFTTQIS